MAQVGQKIFHMIICFRCPFISTNPLLAAMSFFFVFLVFLLLNLVRSFSPKPQNVEIKFLCKVVVQQTQFCVPKFFWTLPQYTLQNEAPKIHFLNTLN